MKNKIYIVRHGQDKDNANGILNGHRDEPLTEIGLKQAEESAQKILDSNIKFDIIFSSPLQRALSTAKIIATKQPAVPLVVDHMLIERNFGIMTGQPISSIAEKCAPNILATEHVNYFLCPKGAETFPNMLDRAKLFLQKLNATYTGQNILLVTHGDFGKMLYAAYYDLDWQEILTKFHFGNTEMLQLSEESAADDYHVFRITQQHSSK